MSKLKEFNPDCILVEGESHFIGGIQSFLYQIFFNKKVGLIKWCFIDLPGEERHGFRFALKFVLHRLVDAYVLYSSYSKKALDRYKINPLSSFIAVNVSDVETHLSNFKSNFIPKAKARNMFGLPNQFSVLFIGNFEKQKRFERFLDVAKICKDQPIQFLVAGGGEGLESYKSIVKDLQIENIKFLGYLSNPSLAYFSSDIVYIPGRGGMVISEAMCFCLPVILHFADGTESDLVYNTGSGYIIQDNAELVADLLSKLVQQQEGVRKMGKRGQKLVEERYNTKNMAAQIVKAAKFSIASRL